MKKSNSVIENLPIEVDKAKTRLFYESLSDSIDKDTDFELWEDFCKNLSHNEAAFFKSLEINPLACQPFVISKNGYVHFECMYAIVAKLHSSDALEFCIERLDICIGRKNDLGDDMLYVTVKCCEKKKSKRKGIIGNIAYFKAKKQTEYKIKIDMQRRLCDMLKSKGVQFVPLSSSETLTYKQVWCELFCSKKYTKSSICNFFSDKNDTLITGAKGDDEFERIRKKGATILLPNVDISVKAVNCARLKLIDFLQFPDIIITSDDFAYTYCRKSDGTSYFYKKSGG